MSIRPAFLLVVLMTSIPTPTARAATPPSDFLALEACAPAGEYSCTLKTLVDQGFAKSKKNWEKSDNADAWILRFEFTDEVSKERMVGALLFHKSKDEFGRPVAQPERLTVAGQNALGTPANQELYAPQFLSRFAAAVGKKDPVRLEKRESDQQKLNSNNQNKIESLMKKIAGSYRDMTGGKSTLRVSDARDHHAKIDLKCEENFSQALHSFSQTPDFDYLNEEGGKLKAQLKNDECAVELVFNNDPDNGLIASVSGPCCASAALVKK